MIKDSGRKRRLPRFSLAPDIDALDFFDPRPDDWLKIESAYGVNLTASQRNWLQRIVDEYLSWQPIESATPFVKDAVRWVKKLDKAIVRSKTVMVDAFGGVDSTLDGTLASAAAGATVDILKNLKALRPGANWQWDDLIWFMQDLHTACERTLEGVLRRNNASDDVKTTAWDFMVLRLLVFAVLSNLPSHVSKGFHKSRTGAVSAFIRLVDQLQKLIPERYRRHRSSHHALAKAVSVVRRKNLSQQSKQTIALIWKELWSEGDLVLESPADHLGEVASRFALRSSGRPAEPMGHDQSGDCRERD